MIFGYSLRPKLSKDLPRCFDRVRSVVALIQSPFAHFLRKLLVYILHTSLRVPSGAGMPSDTLERKYLPCSLPLRNVVCEKMKCATSSPPLLLNLRDHVCLYQIRLRVIYFQGDSQECTPCSDKGLYVQGQGVKRDLQI